MTVRSRGSAHRPLRWPAGFTLIELMVVVAVIAVVLVLAAPSFRDLIEMRRLRGVTEQLLTDIQFARTEAASRQERVGLSFRANSALTCYSIFACGTMASPNCACECTSTPACAAPVREIRTVRVESLPGPRVAPAVVPGATALADSVIFDPATGGMASYELVGIAGSPVNVGGEFWLLSALTSPGPTRSLRLVINPAGRPRICVPAGSIVKGDTPCD